MGCFPGADLPYGLLDMSGNVWEWTRSLWGKEMFMPSEFNYPYDPQDKRREDLQSSFPRVLRGGAFHDIDWFARCASRSGLDPGLIDGDYGFRVVLLPG